jgi:hypothetical protein
MNDEARIGDYYGEIDELKFVDDDIKKEFDGKIYHVGTPSIVQLSRDIKELIKTIKDK